MRSVQEALNNEAKHSVSRFAEGWMRSPRPLRGLAMTRHLRPASGSGAVQTHEAAIIVFGQLAHQRGESHGVLRYTTL